GAPGRTAHHITEREWRNRPWPGPVCYDPLERGVGGTRRIACGARSARKALPHILATYLRLRAATRRQCRGCRGSYSGVLRFIARAQRFEQCAQGKGTASFLPACFSEAFFD